MSHVIGLKAVIVAFLLLYYTYSFPNMRIQELQLFELNKSLPLRLDNP
jgi:hypothetical protein